MDEANLRDLRETVSQTKAFLGVMFDGDADRMHLVDETGTVITPSVCVAMIARIILTRYPESTVIYNTPCSHIVPETIHACGGQSLRSKVGNVYIKEMMRARDDVYFAGEHSGHYFFRENANIDSGIIAFLVILEYLCHTGKTASEVRRELERYACIPETNVRVSDVSTVIARIRAHYPRDLQEESDGITVTYPDWWCSVRASMNEPLLRINMEAESREILDARLAEILALTR